MVGPKDAGKTTFCQRFLGRGHEATADIPTEELPRSTVNSVTVYGQPKYLVLLDTDINTAADCLTPLQVRLQSCHVLKPGRLAFPSFLLSRLAVTSSAWSTTAPAPGHFSVFSMSFT